MKAISYDLEFKGQNAQVKEGVFHVVSTAASSTFSTVVSSSGVREKDTATRGGKAYFESDVTITGEDTFQEKGRIKFGKSGKHGFSFSTVGAGSFKTGPDKGGMHGAVMWRITRGFGQFKGAKGYITSNFSVDSEGRLVDRQVGQFFTKG